MDAAQLQEAYRDGTASVGTYLYPTAPALFFLKAIELNYTDTNAQHYVTAEQIDVSNIPNRLSFSYLRTQTLPQAPKFDDHGDWFEIFPTPTSANNLTSLIRIIYFAQPTDYTSVTDTITYPETLDYRILGWRIASNYYYSLNKIAEGDSFNKKYEERVEQIIGTVGRGTQQPLQATIIQDSGWGY